MLAGYLRLMVFALLLLVALQVPAFFVHYQQLLHERLVAVEQQLQGFQEAANKHFNGSLSALIESYHTSKDAEFRKQSESVVVLYRQLQRLQAQEAQLQVPWYQLVIKGMPSYDSELLKEAGQKFSYNTSLSQQSIVMVIAVLFIMLLVAESTLRLLLAGIAYVFVVPKRVKR